VVVRRASPLWYRYLHLRYGPVRINHSRQRGNRVAGDKIFTEGLERQRDLIRERTGPPQPPTIPNSRRGSATTHTANVIAAHTPMDLTSFEHNRVSVQKGSGGSGERMMSWVCSYSVSRFRALTRSASNCMFSSSPSKSRLRLAIGFDVVELDLSHEFPFYSGLRWH
jgi:hypothetical protein